MDLRLSKRGNLLSAVTESLALTEHLPQRAMSRRQPCHNTSRGERLWFMWLWSRGVSVRNIAKHARRSPTTVKRWVKRLRTEQHTPCTVPRGQPPQPPPYFHSPAHTPLPRPLGMHFHKVCSERYIHDVLGLTYHRNLQMYCAKYR